MDKALFILIAGIKADAEVKVFQIREEARRVINRLLCRSSRGRRRSRRIGGGAGIGRSLEGLRLCCLRSRVGGLRRGSGLRRRLGRCRRRLRHTRSRFSRSSSRGRSSGSIAGHFILDNLDLNAIGFFVRSHKENIIILCFVQKCKVLDSFVCHS